MWVMGVECFKSQPGFGASDPDVPFVQQQLLRCVLLELATLLQEFISAKDIAASTFSPPQICHS